MPGGTEWLLLLIGLPLYFLPTIIAATRHHQATIGVFFLNLFLGWTFLGWIAALIWAFSYGSRATQTVIVNNSSQPYSQADNPNFSSQPQSDSSQKQSGTQQEKIDQLRQYKQLLDEGVITNDEFNKQKEIILGQ
ncbi:superinfection immunity protein [Pseudobacter ginsenosidimutans]|nr:superinfection immunity protein [Pseudobacter ginsenosidimutans]